MSESKEAERNTYFDLEGLVSMAIFHNRLALMHPGSDALGACSLS